MENSEVPNTATPSNEMSTTSLLVLVAVTGVLLLGGVGGCMFGMPLYNRWRAGVSGEAELRKAESTKRIMVETARAEVEAAKLQAEAIQIVGEAATKYPAYRQQQFIQAFAEAIKEGDVKMIFVPTEAQIPIMPTGEFPAKK